MSTEPRSNVTVPARTVPAVDLMDEAMVMLRTVYTILTETGLAGTEYVDECASILWAATEKLDPVRELVNQMDAAQ